MIRRFCFAFLTFIFLVQSPFTEHLRITCGTNGQELQQCKAGAEAWAKKTGHTVEVIPLPYSLGNLQQMMAAKSDDIDVFLLDMVWVGMLQDYLKDISADVTEKERQSFFPAMLDSNRIKGKLKALPWYTDVGLLYYRKDLLEKYNKPVPSTWEELTETAKAIQTAERAAGVDQMWGFVFQGRSDECLACNAMEYIAAFGGGNVIEVDGKVSVDNEDAHGALKLVSTWIGDIAPKGVANYAEEESRGVFQSGNAVFMRNWPYVWKLATSDDSSIADKIAVAPLPKGGKNGRHAGTLGGWQLGVSKFSKHQALAVELIKYLTGPVEQKRRAIEGGYFPTIIALYDDQDVQNAQPLLSKIFPSLKEAIARPTGPTGDKYGKFSNAFQISVHKILVQKAPVEKEVKSLANKLKLLVRD